MGDKIIIDRDDFPSNSFKKDNPGKAEEVRDSKQQPIVTKGTVTRRKKSGGSFAEAFISEDARSIKSYIVTDIVIPAIKDMIVESIRSGVETLFYGRSGMTRSTRSSGHRAPTSYSSYYERDQRSGRRLNESRPKNRHILDDIVLSDRQEASAILDTLSELIDQYGVATVMDLYDLAGVTGNYIDTEWGWNSLGSASIRRVRDGYLLDLPRPKALN